MVVEDVVVYRAGKKASELVQSKSSNPLKVLNKEYKVIYIMYKSGKFGLVLTVIYINTANWILRNMDFAKLRNMDSAK